MVFGDRSQRAEEKFMHKCRELYTLAYKNNMHRITHKRALIDRVAPSAER